MYPHQEPLQQPLQCCTQYCLYSSKVCYLDAVSCSGNLLFSPDSSCVTWPLSSSAFYSEPRVQISVSRSGVELLLTSRGFPSATLEWHDEQGQDVTNRTVTEVQMDPQGLYTVSSKFAQGPAANTSLRFILRNPVLQQEMMRDLALSIGQTLDLGHLILPPFYSL